MNWVQLAGLVLFAVGLCSLVTAPVVMLARRIRKAATPSIWPARLMIVGIFGLALGYGMMWGPSLVIGAASDRAAKEKRFE